MEWLGFWLGLGIALLGANISRAIRYYAECKYNVEDDE